jgi:lysophospholipase L1-like esterase
MKKILKYYCIGDSITNGARNEYYRDYSSELNYLFRNKNICFSNYSINGETTSEIIKRLIRIVFTKEVDGIIFMGGTNDTKIPTPKTLFKKNILIVISICQKFNIKLIILNLPKIYGGLPCYSQIKGNFYIKMYNKIIYDLSIKNKFTHINLFNISPSLLIDGIHSNNKGCEYIAKKIFLNLNKII